MKLADSQIIRLLKQILAATSGGAGVAWGAITGTLSNQTDLQSALDAKQTSAQVQTIADAKVESEAYGPDWNGDTTHAPAKNDVYDKIEAVVASIPVAPNKRVTGSVTWAPGGGEGSAVVSGNIASVTRNGAGQYLAVFTATQSGVPYIVSVTVGASSPGNPPFSVSVPVGTIGDADFVVETFDISDALADPFLAQILVFQ